MTVARSRYLLALILGLIVVVILLAVESSTRRVTDTVTRTDEGETPVEVANGITPFTLSGALQTALSPGRSEALDIRITNPHDHSLTVSEVIVTVDAVDAPNETAALPCSPTDFSTGPVSAPKSGATVDPEATASLSELGWNEKHWPLITMLDTGTNQDGCIDATLTLVFRGSGVLER